MTQTEALRLALEALEVANSCVDGYYIPKGKTHLPEIELAITAIKETLAQPEQEPVAFVKGWNCGRLEVIVRSLNQRFEIDQPLYTTPPQRKPLTDEEIDQICGDVGYGYIAVARAIEAAHGIKEEA